MTAIGAAARAGVGAAALLADESMMNMAHFDGSDQGLLHPQTVRIGEKHPEESLTIMRGWMTQEQE